MLMRKYAYSVAVAAALLAAVPAVAQSVFVPMDDTSTTQSQSPSTTPAPSLSVPMAPQTTAPAVRTPTVRAPGQPQLPVVSVPQKATIAPQQRDELAYRAFGVERPVSSGIGKDGSVAGFTPEQLAAGRRVFAAMETANPAMAAVNPFAMLDMQQLAEKLQKQLSDRVANSCEIPNFTSMISTTTFLQDKKAQETLAASTYPALGNILNDYCKDEDNRRRMGLFIPLFTVVHRKGVETNVEYGQGIMTLTADFSADEPPAIALIRSRFEKAMEQSEEETTADYKKTVEETGRRQGINTSTRSN